MTKALLIGRTARVGLDADEEAALKVGEGVEVEEEVVDLILRDDVVGLHLTLVVLGWKSEHGGDQHGPASEQDATPERKLTWSTSRSCTYLRSLSRISLTTMERSSEGPAGVAPASGASGASSSTPCSSSKSSSLVTVLMTCSELGSASHRSYELQYNPP